MMVFFVHICLINYGSVLNKYMSTCLQGSPFYVIFQNVCISEFPIHVLYFVHIFLRISSTHIVYVYEGLSQVCHFPFHGCRFITDALPHNVWAWHGKETVEWICAWPPMAQMEKPPMCSQWNWYLLRQGFYSDRRLVYLTWSITKLFCCTFFLCYATVDCMRTFYVS